jgi:ketosteroid isomerase-like protein
MAPACNAPRATIPRVRESQDLREFIREQTLLRRDRAGRVTLSLDEKRAQVRQLIGALEARDFDAIAALEFYDADAEFRSTISASEGEVYRGVEGLRAWAMSVDEIWEDFRVEVAEVHDAGENRAVVIFNVTGTAKVSGVPLDTQTGQVWTWSDDGVVIRNDSFGHAHAAFEFAGLPYGPSTRST